MGEPPRGGHAIAIARPIVFWSTIAIIALVMLVLSHEILLPFGIGVVSSGYSLSRLLPGHVCDANMPVR
jgi:hypothetical protein